MKGRIIKVEKATIIKKMEFEAAHFLPRVHYTGKCNNPHGHSYKIFVAVRGEIDPDTGMVMDFSLIKKAMKGCIEELDHTLLNEYIPNPTAENIVLWVWKCLVKYKAMHGVSYIELWETSNSRCIIEREDIEPLIKKWKDGYEL